MMSELIEMTVFGGAQITAVAKHIVTVASKGAGRGAEVSFVNGKSIEVRETYEAVLTAWLMAMDEGKQDEPSRGEHDPAQNRGQAGVRSGSVAGRRAERQ